MKRFRVFPLTIAMIVICLPVFAQSSYDDLLKFDQDFLEFAKPRMRGTRPNYGDPNLKSTAEMQAQKAGLEKFRQRLRAMDTSSWSVPEKVDYLLVWARLNQLDYAHRVLKPWVRDPMRYYDRVSRLPFTEVPIPLAEQAEFAAHLKAVPSIMKEAETNLTEARGELTALAIFHLENFDGVGQREPFRASPPDGTIGWYKDLCARLQQDGSDLVADCQKASTAVAGYRDWLKANFDKMPFSAAVGNDNFNWYIRNVRLLPYTIDDLKLLGKRELARFRWAYIVDRAKEPALARARADPKRRRARGKDSAGGDANPHHHRATEPHDHPRLHAVRVRDRHLLEPESGDEAALLGRAPVPERYQQPCPRFDPGTPFRQRDACANHQSDSQDLP